MNEEQKNRFKKLIQKVSNEILVEIKIHFEETDVPAPWMHDTLDEDEVNAIKKIVVLDVLESSITEYYKCDVKVILDGKKIARMFHPEDTLDSIDYRLLEITGLKIYLYIEEVEAEDFDPQW
jgi:hypothetical protein